MPIPFPDVVELPSGLKLETLFTAPTETLSSGSSGLSKKLAVCLHPWSRLGGNMHDPVLASIVRPLVQEGHFHVLRYNSRGVRRSSGWASFTGFQEAEDLKEFVNYAIEALGSVKEVAIIGYSNGSLPASLHPVLPEPIRTSHILISYPVGPRAFLTLFNSGVYQCRLQELLQQPRAHILLQYGDQDEFTGITSYERWLEQLNSAAQTASGSLDGVLGPPIGGAFRQVRVNGASHFWSGSAGRKMVQEIISFLREA
ncbi:alpha/beta-hydrolase [Artomyces pyxidatus]|uniref:Alpha/beta-hydrolase n=1 Tax=Artomyces pyxidatus TaxID=48021 RepID=A0ACB8TFQ1_9AGAM|nr:alpha/beta-hydrolase [Artomyces pyxidatus]